MQAFISKRAVILFIGLIFIFAFGTATSTAQQTFIIAGKITCTDTDPKQIDVGNTKDHIISLGTSEGTNISTGEHEFMDGAQAVNMAYNDLVEGNGPQQGYMKLTKNGDTVFSVWRGKVVATINPEGTPSTTFEGIVSFIKGTGRFENIQGSGSYTGRYTSKTDYIVEWKGKYFIEKAPIPSNSEPK